MFIKNLLTRMVAKLTGRKCSRCLHNCGARCCHPNGRMFMKCWHSITRPGFSKRPLQNDLDLTPEEQHQLQKIRDVLQEAEDTARGCGLVED